MRTFLRATRRATLAFLLLAFARTVRFRRHAFPPFEGRALFLPLRVLLQHVYVNAARQRLSPLPLRFLHCTRMRFPRMETRREVPQRLRAARRAFFRAILRARLSDLEPAVRMTFRFLPQRGAA